MEVQCVLSTFTPENHLKIVILNTAVLQCLSSLEPPDVYRTLVSVWRLEGYKCAVYVWRFETSVCPSIFIDVRIEAVLDVTRVSERLMVVRSDCGRSGRRSKVEKDEFLVMLGEVVSGIYKCW